MMREPRNDERAKTIVALEMTPIRNSVRGRRDQIFDRLSKTYHVVYVSKMQNILSIIKHQPRDLWKYRKWYVEGCPPNYTRVLLPAVFLPGGNIFRCINKINNKILSMLLYCLLRQLGVRKVDIWWVGYPYAVDCVNGRGTTVYDCFDEHTGWKGLYSRKVVTEIEADMLRIADVAFFSSSTLYVNKAALTRRPILVRNAADVDHFNVPEEESLTKDRIVLYSGVISNWFDVETVQYAVDTLSEFTFWFVGPDRGGYLQNIRSLPNVKHFGMRPYDELPEFYRRASVCIIPFRMEPLIENTNPIKLYEYLAAGKPVVSTGLPEVEHYSEVAYIAKNKSEFVSKIEQAVEENDLSRVRRRQQVARENSWEHRVDVIQSELP